MVQFDWTDIEHAGRVVYGVIPVLSGNLSIHEVISTNFQETSLGLFQ